MRCPTCAKIGLPDSYWCSQECFKSSWSGHKACHVFYAESPNGQFEDRRFQGFQYVGPTRKGKVGPPRLVPPEIRRPVYVTNPRGVDPRETDAKREKMIACNTGKEIEIMRRVCAMGREVLDIAHRACRVGITTDEIDRIVHEATIERGAYPSPLGYGFFPKSCCTSVNDVVCHGVPDTTVLKDGDIINVDVSLYFQGMHADLNETYCIGNVDARGRELVAATYDCMWRAIKMCKPGVFYRDLGDVITKEAKAHNFSVIRTYCLADDMQILTQDGFMGYPELQAAVDADPEFRVAEYVPQLDEHGCQDGGKFRFVRPSRVVYNAPGTDDRLVMFGNSLLVTRDHDMYAATAPQSEFKKTKASDLQQHQQHLVFQGRAKHGTEVSSLLSEDSEMVCVFGLDSDAKLSAFLTLYGLWLVGADKETDFYRLQLGVLGASAVEVLEHYFAGGVAVWNRPQWQMRAVVEGMSHSRKDSILAPSIAVRDMAVRLLLLAGFCAQFDSVGDGSSWEVRFGAQHEQPIVHQVSEVEYNSYTWCVTVDSGFIMTRRVLERRSHDKAVLQATQPVVVGNCGHGTGELFHCSPTVPHYANNKATGRMQPGHIFTIEPMINEGDWKEFRWPDDWTSTTQDGMRSAQFEETILITEDGYEVLTKGSYIPEGARLKP